MSEQRKVHIKTFGCQMNAYDSERIVELLAPLGFAETADVEDADVVVLNTCHIREKAAEKVYSDLGRLRAVKERRRAEGRDTLVTVAGCVAQAEGAEIVRREPSVDVVVGPQSYHQLGALLARAKSDLSPIVETDFPERDKFASLPARTGKGAPAAFLTVQEGCDKFCTFCVVPYTRGAEYSRPVADVEAEARRLAERGVRELTLLGQNVNAYHGTEPDGRTWSLADLIRRLASIDGIDRLRYTTSHPRDMDDALIAAHGEVEALMPYLHLPVQAGSDKVLKAMNRAHTAESYVRLAQAYADRFGRGLCITDSYRSYGAQLTAFALKPGLAAVPGTSNHGWALAVDLCGGVNSFRTAQWRWMAENAGRFGWVQPAWAGPQGEKPEPWHWEFGIIS